MKKWLISLIFFFAAVFFLPNFVFGQQVTPTPPKQYPCPPEFSQIYLQQQNGEKCAENYEEFKTDPAKYHFWTDDEEVTIQGRADERARQFIYWAMTHSSIDNHPVLLKVWSTARNLSYFFTILVAALLGLAIIIGQKTSYQTGVKLWPAVTRILFSLLYIAFSATIVITIIQLSDVLMKFFIENLGGKDLFNIFFSGISQEKNYIFFGIKDLNIGAQESVKTELFVLKLTEITYYLLGGMLILREIILWFLLFVSPFLPLLFSFSFIKNVGWIWVGVFFQWVFYGPLMALFLGGLTTIWKGGIPFIFDFSRSGTAAGYIYPTAMNLTYSGPHASPGNLNSGNYVDTFVEYIITLIMLWVVTFFPWWLLRNFRDYCCDGINAIKNMILSNLPGRGSPSPLPSPANLISDFSAALKTSREVETSVKTRIETTEEIKKAKTEEIVNSLDIRALKITDIAHFETNKTVYESANRNINYLKNPISASTSSERQKYMNLRSELSDRAAKADPIARQVIGTVSGSRAEQINYRQNIINTLPKAVSATQVISSRIKLPQEKIQQVSSSVINMVVGQSDTVSAIAEKTGVEIGKASQILSLIHKNITLPATEIVQKISIETNVDKDKVMAVLKEFSAQVRADDRIAEAVAKEQNLSLEEIKQVIEAQLPALIEAQKNIEQSVAVPQTVSLDEYEQVKKMWMKQYEKGEVPVTENIKTRSAWVDQDVVIITNTLNKLLSSQEEIKQQGLDEVGYTLPIFLVNNLSGEQLVAYLKAKIEAAKTVKDLLDREKEVTEKLKARSEEVMVEKPKVKEKEKTMRMQEELEEVK